MRFVSLFLVVLVIVGITFLVLSQTPGSTTVATSTLSTSSTQKIPTPELSATSIGATTSASTSHTASTTSVVGRVPKKPASKPKNEQSSSSSSPVQAEPAPPPYSFPPKSFETVDVAARSALVNILCMPESGTLRPISGSGVLIDPRGIILTNAHVAQYVLLSESQQINLSCTIRTGSPAVPRWKATVLYMPPVWVNDHYKDLNASRVIGTGEHDYALLFITSDVEGNHISNPLPYLPVDARENIAFEGDAVLGAGYPAEFAGGIAAQQGLYAVTSISKIRQLLTFQTASIDVLSIGGVIEAQGGSSGGPLVNAWGFVIGIISTTSEGATTAERDLHVLSLNYIGRDFALQTGRTFKALLAGNPTEEAVTFSRQTAPDLVKKYVDYLMR